MSGALPTAMVYIAAGVCSYVFDAPRAVSKHSLSWKIMSLAKLLPKQNTKEIHISIPMFVTTKLPL